MAKYRSGNYAIVQGQCHIEMAGGCKNVTGKKPPYVSAKNIPCLSTWEVNLTPFCSGINLFRPVCTSQDEITA